MNFYPAIDIKDGKFIRLKQGRLDEVTVYGNSPVEIAKKFTEAGAKWMHVVDIDGAFKEIATFQCAYDEIREAHNIPENWDERDAEEAEIDHHIKQAFRQAHREMVGSGCITSGNMEYLEQYGIHIQTANKIIADYIASEDEMISEGKLPTVKHLYAFLDRMAETFHDAHKDVMNRIGIKELIKEDFLYLENKDDIS